MPHMTRVPSDLTRFGLRVETVPGWETRGSSSFAPACVVCHWTAGPRGTTRRASLDVCVNGRPGLSGPLCNVYLDRDGVCVIVGAGRANHAGVGGYRGLVGNSAAYGIEAESAGNGDWTDAQRATYPRLVAALLSGLGRDASWACGHSEWATPPGRKTDINDWPMPAMRAQAAAILADPTQEDDMPLNADDLNKIRGLFPAQGGLTDVIANRTRQHIAGVGPYSLNSLLGRLAKIEGQNVALTEAVAQLEQGGGLDGAAIADAAERGAQTALAGLGEVLAAADDPSA